MILIQSSRFGKYRFAWGVQLGHEIVCLSELRY